MRVRKEVMTKEDFSLIAKASDALAHPARVAIFRYIYQKNLNRENVCNKDLVKEFDYSQSTISQHVSKLIIGGLVEVKSEGPKNYYYVNLGELGQYLNSVKKLNQ